MIRLTLPLPPSVNHIYRRCRGRTFLTDEARAYKELVGVLCVGQDVPAKGDLALSVVEHMSTRRGDIDNPLKVLVDSLAAGLGFNDRRITRLLIDKKLDRRNPRVEIVLSWEE